MKRKAGKDISKKGEIKRSGSFKNTGAIQSSNPYSLIQDKGLKGEVKYTEASVGTDPSFGSVAFTTPALLNGLTVGTDNNNRIGRKVVWTKIMCRYFVNQGSSTGGANFRILVVYDKQTNGVAPSITDILNADSFTSFNNLNNRDRFITIIDHITESVSQNGNASVAGIITRKLSLDTIWNADTTAVVGAINTGSIYAMIAQTGGDITQSPDSSMRFRLRFVDS